MYIICLFGGAPRQCPWAATAFHEYFHGIHGQPRPFHWLPLTLHGLPRTFHGLSRNAAAINETPWRLMPLAIVISTAISTARSIAISAARSTAISTAIFTATHGKHPRHTTAGRGTAERLTAMPTAWGWPWNMPWVAVVLPWVAMDGTTEVATDRTVARAMATTVALAVEAPCTIESRGPCRENPRISTVARGKTHGRPRKCHGHFRGPPPKSQVLCIGDAGLCGVTLRTA